MDDRTPDLFGPDTGDDAAPIETHASQAPTESPFETSSSTHKGIPGR